MIKQILLICLLLAGTSFRVFACGYSFVGGCSTDLDLAINGTQHTFGIAPCATATPFNGLYLDTLRSLSLKRVRGITWESCINNVSSMSLFYRISIAGQNNGPWQVISIPEAYNTLEGPYTTRYRSLETNKNLVAGLTPGLTYTLEVYFFAEVDTIGDDFIPETFMFQNNDGNNYKLNFTFGGPSASKLVAVVTKNEALRCATDSTGVAEIVVFGSTDPASLFYSWSSNTQNFFQINHLPPGSYTATVTETSTGETSTATVNIGSPEALLIQVQQLQPITCLVSEGYVQVSIEGGVPPYQIEWSNGDSTLLVSSTTNVLLQALVTDSNGCQTQKEIAIEAFLDPPFVLSTALGIAKPLCDQWPDSVAIQYKALSDENNMNYQWFQNGNLIGNVDILELSFPLSLTQPYVQGAELTLIATNQYGCTNTQLVTPQVELIPVLPIELYLGTSSNCNGTIRLNCGIFGGTPPYLFNWGGTTTTEPYTDVLPGLVELSISDALGCTTSVFVVAEDFYVTGSSVPASGSNVADGRASVSAEGAVNTPYQVSWSTGEGGDVIEGLLPGIYCATITDAIGCSRDTCIEVSFVSGSTEATLRAGLSIVPNPASAGASVQVPVAEEGRIWELYSFDGRLVQTQLVAAGSTTVILPQNIPTGTYTAMLLSSKFRQIGKIFLGDGR